MREPIGSILVRWRETVAQLAWRLPEPSVKPPSDRRGIMPNLNIGNKVRRLREKKAWTQEHLAKAAAISLRTVVQSRSI